MEKIIHLLIPRSSNNHKAKLLHSQSLLILILVYAVFQNILTFIPHFKPNILGFAAQISPEEVIRLTNQKRADAGLPALTFNQTLSSAAYTKARDMIDRDYWSHTAPDGTQPWSFFSKFGYRYRYAGENLARDFSSASSAVEAWMNSPTHRDNILNPKYKEIGIGVTEGDLAGVDTTIIVQFFGATYADKINAPVAKVEEKQIPSKPVATETPVILKTPIVNEARITSINDDQKVLISPFNVTRTTSITVVTVLLLVFIVDGVLVSRRKITRIAGRTLAHVTFLAMILSIILILKSGKIL